MGIYVSKPVTEKDSCDEEYTTIKCGSSSMQGWRTAQEDAHNAILDFDKDCCFFAVYDGHGGHEVAEYSAAHLPEHLLNNVIYKKGNYKEALIDAFLTFDAHLLLPEAMATIKKIARSKKGEAECESTDSEDPEEVTVLRREADMPIDELLASNYSEKHACAARLQASEPDSVSSPVLRPKRVRQVSSLDDDAPLDDCKEPSPSSNSSKSSDNSNKESEKLLSEKKDSSNVLSSSKSSDIKLDSNGDVTRPEKGLVNGQIEKSSVQSECSDERTDSDIKVNGEIKEHGGGEDGLANNGEAEITEHETQLVVEGRRIVPSTLSTTTSVVGKSCDGDEKASVDTPSYTGKGKSGGKGGKVKGASTITTTTQDLEPKAGRARRAALADAKRKVLSGDDIDSEEDEDEEDETFAIEGAEEDDEDMDDLDEEGDSSDDEGEVVGSVIERVGEDDEEDEDEESDSDDEGPMYNAEDVDVYNEFSATMRDGPGFDSGCTACVALLHKSTLLVANVGDSRCVVSRAGKAIEMSLDHKPEDTIETDRIVKAGGKVTADGRVNGGLNLSRAFGDHGYKQNLSLSAAEQMISPLPDVKVLSLCQQDDFVIIACDGIWNSLTSQQAVDFVCERLKEDSDVQLSSICEQMFEHCLAPNLDGDGTGCDNMTCIIFSFKNKQAFPPTASDEPEIFEMATSSKAAQDDEQSLEVDSGEGSHEKVPLLTAPDEVASANGKQLNGSSSASPADHEEHATNEEEEDENEDEESVEVKKEVSCPVNGTVGAESDHNDDKSAAKRAAEESDLSSLADDRPGKKAKLDISSPAV